MGGTASRAMRVAVVASTRNTGTYDATSTTPASTVQIAAACHVVRSSRASTPQAASPTTTVTWVTTTRSIRTAPIESVIR